MKKFCRISVMILLCLPVAFLRLAAQDAPYYHHVRPASTGSEALRPESSGFSGTGGNIDVIYHKIYWRINPDSAVKYIKGYVQTNFKTIQANVSVVSFDLRNVLVIDSVIFRGAQLPAANITRTGNVVAVDLGVTLANNFIDSFRVYYQGTPPAVSGAAQGYQKATSATAGNYITSLSESYEDRDWWPCKADMQDKVDSMDITVNVPWATPTAADTFWVASNGKLVDSTIIGNSRNFVFKSRNPVASYLVFVSVAKYNRYYRSVNISGTEVPVVYNLFQGKTNAQYTSILTAMDNINPLVASFSTRFGDYPFKNEKHGFYDGLLGAGGMEHQTMSGIATSSLTSLRTLAHELNHQWFGDNVTFGTWNDLWLAEGFARYSEALCGELIPALGINPYTTRLSFKNAALSSTVSAWIPNSNIASSDLIWNSAYGSAVYERGAMIVSMLRAMSGDQKFYQALTNYQTALKGKSATADSLKNQFNAVLGRDITPFFNDYVGGSGNGTTAVGGKGYPTNTVNWNSPVANKLVIQAGGQTPSGGANVTYFRGPVVLHVKGTIASQDTTITYFDWGGGNLSLAGNGIAAPVAGGKLSYILSFTPVTVAYDDSARTLSNGTTVNVPGLTDGSFSIGASAAATAVCPAPATMSTTLNVSSGDGFTGPVTLTATAGVPAGTTVTFSNNPVTPGGSTQVILNNASSLAAGTYNVTVQGTAAGVPSQTTTVSFIINPGTGPAITAQPTGQSVCAGTNVTFSISSPGATGLQWQLSTDGGITWTNIPGATTSALVLNGVNTAMNNNRYRCIATTFCGAANSNAATLNVTSPVSVSAQPGNVAVCSGSSASFSVTASNTQTISYQWQISTDGGTSWTNISGANTSSYVINNTTTSMSNNRFRCLLSNTACSAPVISGTGILTVRQLPTAILSAAPLSSLLPGQTTTLSATTSSGTGGTMSITWSYNGTLAAINGNSYLVNVEKTGTYRLQVKETWSDGLVCAALSPDVTITAVASSRLFIFPSPNNGQFQVAYYNEGGAVAQRRIIITSASGQLVYDKQVNISGPYTLLNIDLRQAATGIYIVAIGDASGKRLVQGKVHIR